MVGAGAWGLPAAAELARRGHDVTLLDRHGPAHQLMSSSGPTRLWRLSHPDRLRVRLGAALGRGLGAARARERHHRDPAPRPALARRRHLAARSPRRSTPRASPHTVVEPRRRRLVLPGPAPRRPGRRSGRRPPDRCWPAPRSTRRPGCSPWRAAASWSGPSCARSTRRGDDVVLRAEDGREFARRRRGAGAGPGCRRAARRARHRRRAPPGARAGLPRRPRAARPTTMPCLYDGPLGDEPGMYAMPTPGRGYKLGIDQPLREWHEDDLDRVPVPERVGRDLRARRAATSPTSTRPCLDAQVCSWTDSPDGRFVIDRVADGRVVLACGDSGEGFKFSALMGTGARRPRRGRRPTPTSRRSASRASRRTAAARPARPRPLTAERSQPAATIRSASTRRGPGRRCADRTRSGGRAGDGGSSRPRSDGQERVATDTTSSSDGRAATNTALRAPRLDERAGDEVAERTGGVRGGAHHADDAAAQRLGRAVLHREVRDRVHRAEEHAGEDPSTSITGYDGRNAMPDARGRRSRIERDDERRATAEPRRRRRRSRARRRRRRRSSR